MITEFLLGILGSVIDALIYGLPDFVLQGIGGFSSLINLFSNISFIIPFGTLGICISIWLVCQGTDFAYQCVMWLIRKIPGVS